MNLKMATIKNSKKLKKLLKTPIQIISNQNILLNVLIGQKIKQDVLCCHAAHNLFVL